MHIEFCLDDGRAVLHRMESDDVTGVLAAAQGEKVVINREFYKYDNHVLKFYHENGEIKQELLIYLVDYLQK